MANTAEDSVGCIMAVIAVIAGGWWLYDHYEIRARADPATIDFKDLPDIPPTPERPTGLLYLFAVKGGSTWNLDTDSVHGGRQDRIAWVVEDHSGNKSVQARKTTVAYRFNCDTSAYWTLQVDDYDKGGTVSAELAENQFTKVASYPPPGSNIATVERNACEPAFDPVPSPPSPEPAAPSLAPPPIR